MKFFRLQSFIWGGWRRWLQWKLYASRIGCKMQAKFQKIRDNLWQSDWTNVWEAHSFRIGLFVFVSFSYISFDCAHAHTQLLSTNHGNRIYLNSFSKWFIPLVLKDAHTVAVYKCIDWKQLLWHKLISICTVRARARGLIQTVSREAEKKINVNS